MRILTDKCQRCGEVIDQAKWDRLKAEVASG